MTEDKMSQKEKTSEDEKKSGSDTSKPRNPKREHGGDAGFGVETSLEKRRGGW